MAHKRPGKHTKIVHTKQGRKRVLVNPNIKRKRTNTSGISKADINKIYKMKLDEASNELRRKGRVRLPELGILRIKIKPARKGGKKVFMPMLGREIITKSKPRTKVVKFRAAKALKEALN